jgi:protein-S-isoprenylcysteine O-methyltransferase Ste14
MTILDAPIIIIPALWLAWMGLWIVAAFYTKPTRWKESAGSRALHIIPLLLCAALLAAPHAFPSVLAARIVAPGRMLPSIGALWVAAGLGLAVWARWYLGRNWSGTVTLKEDHALVRTGPYRFARHPIYTGLLIALIGTAAAIGELRGVLAVACAFIGLVWKIRVEEERMRLTFPEYEEYRKETAALIPLLF